MILIENPWMPISTLPNCDDEIWLCRGTAIEGPRKPQFDDSDLWDWWCYASAPPPPCEIKNAWDFDYQDIKQAVDEIEGKAFELQRRQGKLAGQHLHEAVRLIRHILERQKI